MHRYAGQTLTRHGRDQTSRREGNLCVEELSVRTAPVGARLLVIYCSYTIFRNPLPLDTSLDSEMAKHKFCAYPRWCMSLVFHLIGHICITVLFLRSCVGLSMTCRRH